MFRDVYGANGEVVRFTIMELRTRKPRVTHTAEERTELRKEVARHKLQKADAADLQIDVMIRRNIELYGP